MPSINSMSVNELTDKFYGIRKFRMNGHEITIDGGLYKIKFMGFIPSQTELPDEFSKWVVSHYHQPYSKSNSEFHTKIWFMADKLMPEGLENQMAQALLRYLIVMYDG